MAAPSSIDHVRELEMSVLGAALLDATACAQLVATFPPERFALPRHRTLAEAIEELFSQGDEVNIATLQATGRIERGLLSECIATTATLTAVPFQVAVLTEGYLAREAETAVQRTAAQLRAVLRGEGDVFETLASLQQRLSDIQLSSNRAASGDTHIRHAVAEALARVEEWREGEPTDFAPSGFYSLDHLTGGFPVGELTTLAAMTGAGKTSLVCQSIRSIAQGEERRRKLPAVVFSAEMSREQIAHRTAAGIARANLRDLRDGCAPPEMYDAYDEALGRVARLNIHVDDEPSPSFAHIAARLQQIRQRAIADGGDGQIALVAVDYDEKVDTEGESEELRVSAIARGLKDLAKRFGVPILALSQYSRKATAREAPSNDWLRYSGKKEHESAMIVHWWHPGYWVERGTPEGKAYGYDPTRPERGHLVVTKNRFGPSGQVALDFEPATTSFSDPFEPSF